MVYLCVLKEILFICRKYKWGDYVWLRKNQKQEKL